MCATCGCGRLEPPRNDILDTDTLVPAPAEPARIDADDVRRHDVEIAVLAKNDRRAAENRAWFEQRKVVALNLLSSPGAGKTTLLERTIRERGARWNLRVIEGDQATAFDADRIAAAGAPVLQINTGTGCHLDADMIAGAREQLELPRGSVLVIENVGNLVCPALFDLGERARAVVASVTEGEDKPLKYPHMFRSCDAVVLNKIDLLPHTGFDVARFRACLAQVNAAAPVLELSARTGAGLDAWYQWVETARGSS